MSLTLRQPRPSDYDALASWVPSSAACLHWAGPRVPFPFSAAELPGLLAIAGGRSYCLAEGSSPACGFAQHWVGVPSTVHLGRIIVSPQARGRGIGRVLCEQLIKEAVQCTGASEITLRVYRDNVAALGLYARLGFVPVEAKSNAAVVFMSAAASLHGAGPSPH